MGYRVNTTFTPLGSFFCGMLKAFSQVRGCYGPRNISHPKGAFGGLFLSVEPIVRLEGCSLRLLGGGFFKALRKYVKAYLLE